MDHINHKNHKITNDHQIFTACNLILKSIIDLR